MLETKNIWHFCLNNVRTTDFITFIAGYFLQPTKCFLNEFDLTIGSYLSVRKTDALVHDSNIKIKRMTGVEPVHRQQEIAGSAGSFKHLCPVGEGSPDMVTVSPDCVWS